MGFTLVPGLRLDTILIQGSIGSCQKWKLRLPIHTPTNALTCICGSTRDIFRDHAFKCRRISKLNAHNIIRDHWASTLQPALATAGCIAPTANLEIENKTYNYPIYQPEDHSIYLSTQTPQHHQQSTSHVPTPPLEWTSQSPTMHQTLRMSSLQVFKNN